MAQTKPKKKLRGTISEPVRIGVIGGSGLYNMPGLENAREVRVKTPFGDPSDALVVGQLEGKRVAFLARHASHSRSASRQRRVDVQFHGVVGHG